MASNAHRCEVDISKHSNDLDFILDKLEILSSDMTKYCSIHKIYYKSNYLFCPKCIDKDDQERTKYFWICHGESKKRNATL